MISAIAEHMKYSIYDLDLSGVQSNAELRSLLAQTSNRWGLAAALGLARHVLGCQHNGEHLSLGERHGLHIMHAGPD